MITTSAKGRMEAICAECGVSEARAKPASLWRFVGELLSLGWRFYGADSPGTEMFFYCPLCRKTIRQKIFDKGE